MAKSGAERQREYRERKAAERAPRVLQPHGTTAAAMRHQRAGEPMCGACAEEWRRHQSEMYRRRRGG